MQLHFELRKSSSPSAINLVMLHGMGGTGMLWRPLAVGLESDFNLLAFDQRGHGKSIQKTEKKHDPTSYGQDVVDSLRRTGFHPSHYVGHSMGVRTAVVAALLAPELCHGLILIDLNLSGIAGGGLGESLSRFLKLIPDRFSSRSEAKDFLFQNSPDASIAQYLLAVSQPLQTGGVFFPFDREALVQTIEEARDFDIREPIKTLARLGKPILLLRGAESGVWSREEFLEDQASFSEFNTVKFQEVAGAGHGLPFEKRVEFCNIVRGFVRG